MLSNPCHYWLSRVFLIFLFVVFSLHSSDLRAEEKKDKTSKNSKKFTSQNKEAWMKAQDYSLENPVVAFAVYGRTPDMTCKQIGEKIKSGYAERGIRSVYFLANEDHMGSAIGLYIKGVPYGPKAIGEIIPVLKEVAAHYSEALPEQLVRRSE